MIPKGNSWTRQFGTEQNKGSLDKIAVAYKSACDLVDTKLAELETKLAEIEKK